MRTWLALDSLHSAASCKPVAVAGELRGVENLLRSDNPVNRVVGSGYRGRTLKKGATHMRGETAGPTSASGDDLRGLAKAFLDRAFDELLVQSVLPASAIRPFLRAGYDFTGTDVMGPEYRELAQRLRILYPERFDRQPGTMPEAASTYLFSLLTAAIARCAVRGTGFGAGADALKEATVEELFTVLGREGHELRCCRVVSHISVDGGDPLSFGRITVVPGDSSDELAGRAKEFIPGAPMWFNADLPFFSASSQALVVAMPEGPTTEPEGCRRDLSSAIDRFLLAARLLHAGTPRSWWEVSGGSMLVSGLYPRQATYEGGGFYDLMELEVTLSPGDGLAFEALGAYLDAAAVKRDGMVVTSFDMALAKYQRAHEQGNGFERLVDLATALEAVLTAGESDNEAVTLRLRNRAAALLATPSDGGTAIFQDIGRLYGLRSTLVHGGSLKESDLRKMIMGISTIPENMPFGTAMAFAVDRLRDLVRRSILARLCLAAGSDPLWPFTGSWPVDAALADDETRTAWRERWRGRLAELGAAWAADPARLGTDPLGR